MRFSVAIAGFKFAASAVNVRDSEAYIFVLPDGLGPRFCVIEAERLLRIIFLAPSFQS